MRGVGDVCPFTVCQFALNAFRTIPESHWNKGHVTYSLLSILWATFTIARRDSDTHRPVRALGFGIPTPWVRYVGGTSTGPCWLAVRCRFDAEQVHASARVVFIIRSLIELRSVVGICRTRSCGTDIFLLFFLAYFCFLMFWNTGCLNAIAK